jgi:hypothetical protein
LLTRDEAWRIAANFAQEFAELLNGSKPIVFCLTAAAKISTAAGRAFVLSLVD